MTTPPNKIIETLLLLIIHGSFVAFLMLENSSSNITFWVATSLTVIMLLGYVFQNHHDHTATKQHGDFWFVSIATGAIITYIISKDLGLGPVIASSLVGVGAAFIPKISVRKINIDPAAIYCGSFIGMCDLYSYSNYSFIMIASFFGALLYWSLQNSFLGYGGKLGSIAFGSVLCASLIFSIL